VTCEHGTCTHGINYALSEHVQFVVNPCDNVAYGMLVSNCYSNQGFMNYSSMCQIVTNVIGSNVWPRFGVLRSGENKRCLSIIVLYECALNVNRLQITLIVYDRTCSRLISAEIYCGNTVSVILIHE
jgi:hypothetical protein